MPTVNGRDWPCGCQVDGHRGQYVPDQLAVTAESLGWRGDGVVGIPPSTPNEGYLNDPRYWRRVAERSEGVGGLSDPGSAWDNHVESAEAILRWLNDRTEDGYCWGWYDGEIFLMPNDWWED